MSHYSVGVITKTKPTESDINDILEPFYENMEVEEYIACTKEQLIQIKRNELETYRTTRYQDYLNNPEEYIKLHSNYPEHLEYIKNFPEQLKKTDEELYQIAIQYYEESDINSNGDVISIYNPKGKWDWWKIGGRFSNCLGNNKNSAQIKDIDFGFNISVDEYIKLHPDIIEKYNDMMCGKDTIYRPEYLKEIYPTLEDYICDIKNFKTYALIDIDGNWYEPGEMGWFGISNETYLGKKEYNEFFKKYISEIPKEYWLTVVDCHK